MLERQIDQRIEVLTTTTTDQGRRASGMEHLLGKALGRLQRIKFPALLSVVHLLLISFGLPTGQIREHAREADLHKRACRVKTAKLTEEILGQFGGRLAFVEARMHIDLSSDDRSVATDPG